MPAEFKMLRLVTFAETDMAGVMHFSNYFRWMEEIEHAFFRSVGMSVVQNHAEDTISWPRVHVSCEYFAPARFEDEIEMKFEIVSLSDKSMTYEVTFWNKGQRIARGRTKAVCCRMSAGGVFESTMIPPKIREKLEVKK
ncbi:MAG TPA: thioesterase family protein [Phycisphaerae bacterium]|nr:thioesterase family protein [Phycisphaerae bacterium]